LNGTPSPNPNSQYWILWIHQFSDHSLLLRRWLSQTETQREREREREIEIEKERERAERYRESERESER
jgi:hypothetical protein